MSNPVRLSVIIPAYNEARRLGGTLRLAAAWLARQPWDAELVVIDDGSSDGTSDIARQFAEKSPVPLQLGLLPANRGKGAAVREGMLHLATGDYRLMYDADGSTPIEMVERLWPCFERGADVVIGSRALPASDIAVRQARYREGMGKLNNLLLRALGLTAFRDTQCGFKAFTASAADAVFSRLRVERFAFDAEALYIARRLGLRIEEIPVHWENAPDTRVHPIADSTRMICDALRIRIRAASGAYGPRAPSKNIDPRPR